MRTSVAVVSWYASNVGVMLLNKYVLSSYNFKKPVFLTLCHMISCSLFANMTVALGTMPKKDVKTCRQGAKIAVLALVFCLSVVLGNVSLRFMPVSFNQAVGATSPFVTAVLSCLILGSKETARTYMALVPIVVGTMIASGFEPSFHFWGFLACICSSVFRGLKSIIQSVLLSSSADKLDSLNLLRYMAPIACLMLLPGVLILEGNAFDQAQAIAARYPSFYYAFFLNSFLAFFVNLTNLLVTSYTNALTLTVLGQGKCVLAVVVSILLFGNPISSVALSGYAMTVCGVIAYSQAKKSAKSAAGAAKHDDSNTESLDVGSRPSLLETVRHSQEPDCKVPTCFINCNSESIV